VTRTALALLFLAAFAITAAANFPIAFGLALIGGKNSSIAAANAAGTIWNARMRDLSVHGIRLGNADVRARPLALLSGVLQLEIHSPRGSAMVTSGIARGIEHVRATANLSELGLAFPADGMVSLDDVTLLFRNGTCGKASGRIKTHAFGGISSGLMLTGDLRCDGNSAIAELSGRAENIRAAVAMNIFADGTYRVEYHASDISPSLGAALKAAGFEQSNGDLVRVEEGKFGT
jgi:Type II secretion system (T2SS), protein N